MEKRDITELADWLKSCVEDLRNTDSPTTYRRVYDEDLAIFVGWGDGFDENDESVYHSKSQPQYCICTKVADRGFYLWDDAYMPWDEKTGEVYDTDSAVFVNTDYLRLAEGLLMDCEDIHEMLLGEELTFG